MSAHQSEHLQPALERATTTLRQALDAACSTDLDRADTGEFIRVEEMLAIANEAAKEAISVRRRLARESKSATPADAPGDAAASDTGAGSSREITGRDGRRWTVFAVHPSGSTGRPSVRERFRDGWLAFDCGNETRRVAPIPDGWQGLPDADLLALCLAAEAAPRRAP
ncbi:MAG TPA: hypothetical protein VHB25_01805 [Gemmatimonadaceae bacterium]|nr:hypothetical protein [Gemmatimonadaceae bacterium]